MPGFGRGGIWPGDGRGPPAGAAPPPRGPGAGRFSPGRAARSPPGAPVPPGRGPGAGRDGGAPAPTPNGLLPTRGARGPGFGDCRLGGTTAPPWLPCWVFCGLFCSRGPACGCAVSCCSKVGCCGAGCCGAGGGDAGLGASVSTFAAAGAGAGAAGAAGPGFMAGFGAAGPGVAGAVGAAGAAAAGCAGWGAGFGRAGPGVGADDERPPPDFDSPDLDGYASRNLRATGASTVDDADFTNSPRSFNLASTSLLVTPSSFASSCTRALPATALLVRVRPAARTRATSSYRLSFMASASRLTHDGSTCLRSVQPGPGNSRAGRAVNQRLQLGSEAASVELTSDT
jgi:hypothetical protein